MDRETARDLQEKASLESYQNPINTMVILRENWTKDAEGNYVDWTKPPYRNGCLLKLVLEGEDPESIPECVRQKRIAEYYALSKRGYNVGKRKK